MRDGCACQDTERHRTGIFSPPIFCASSSDRRAANRQKVVRTSIAKRGGQMTKLDPTEFCEAILRSEIAYNTENNVVPSESAVAERLLGRRIAPRWSTARSILVPTTGSAPISSKASVSARGRATERAPESRRPRSHPAARAQAHRQSSSSHSVIQTISTTR
jgi:hypothetical protein